MSSGSSPASEAAHHPHDALGQREHLRSARLAVARWGSEDVHHQVARLLDALPPGPVIDLGCGDGALREAMPAHARPRWLGIDRSRSILAAGPRPAATADAVALPLRSGSAAAVAALWMLYELDEPEAAIAEAARVLVPGGALFACSTRRDDAPELAEHFDNPATTFDAEDAPDLVGEHFTDVEVLAWDAPLVHLPDRESLVTYLRARGASAPSAEAAAATLRTPLSITRRGSLVVGRRPR